MIKRLILFFLSFIAAAGYGQHLHDILTVTKVQTGNSDSINIFTLKLSDSIKIEMVMVEEGSFNLGSDKGYSNESPVRRVQVSDFLMGRFEVTQKLWYFVMRHNPSYFSDCDNCPVERITWTDAMQFIERLNELTKLHFRLPSEAEWEYAASGGRNNRKIYKYSGSSKIDEVAWFITNAGSRTHPAGTKKSNSLGLFDMSGNVYEWTRDWMGKYRKDQKLNPKGPEKGKAKVIRGGCWHDTEEGCRVKCRVEMKPAEKNGCVGMRLAHDATLFRD